MNIEKFEDILSWQKAKILTLNIYKKFHTSRDFGFKDQIERASVSIMNNIAEGFERRGNKEFRQFLFISKGSCGEVRSMLNLALNLKYITNDKFELLNSACIEESKIISGLISSLK